MSTRFATEATMRFLVVGGATETAVEPGLSAAGADPELMAHTPCADLEIVAYGRPVRAPVVPVTPTGCPTPAVVTRAVRELVGFEFVAVDAGLAAPTAAPTVGVGADPGGHVRDRDPVPDAQATFDRARAFARALPDDRLVVGETVPGGTTSALGVLTALGERATVSSSLSDNPIERKREVVAEGLAASDIGPPVADPLTAVRRVGDPVLATLAGVVAGAADAGTEVTLAGGTQMAAAAAVARGLGVEADVEVATTSFVAADGTAAIRDLAADLDLALTVTDPGFDAVDHPATNAYAAGEAKEGVGMGGALALAETAGYDMAAVRQRLLTVYDRLAADREEASA
ncbi:MAG: nicotinate-nucleotide--dimethylbenzimidazole phosphoribosyltransferase [Halolamina sp.]